MPRQMKLKEVSLDKIKFSRFNPRSTIDEAKLRELAKSIEKLGLIHAVLLRPVKDGYEVVVGERRVRAARKARKKSIPAVILEVSDKEALEMALVENIHREDLSAVDKGRIVKLLMEKFPEEYRTQEDVAARLGISHVTINDWLTLVEASTKVQKMVAPADKSGKTPKGKLDYKTAVEIVRKIPDKRRQAEVAETIAKLRPSYRQREKIIKEAALKPEKPVEEIVRKYQKVQLPFEPIHATLILRGKKTQTSRSGIPPGLKEGDVIEAYTKFAELKVTKIERKKLKEFTEEDAKREGGYTLAEFKRVWRRLHGEWDPDRTVTVIHFKLRKEFL